MSHRPCINAVLVFFSLIAMPFQQATAFIFGEEEISLAFDTSIAGGLSLMSNNEMASTYGNYRPYEALLRIYNQDVDTSNLDVHDYQYRSNYHYGFEMWLDKRPYLVDKILAFEAKEGTNVGTVSIYDRSYEIGELKSKQSIDAYMNNIEKDYKKKFDIDSPQYYQTSDREGENLPLVAIQMLDNYRGEQRLHLEGALKDIQIERFRHVRMTQGIVSTATKQAHNACGKFSFSGKCKLLGGTLNYKWEGMSPDQQFQLRNKELVQSHKRMVQKDANRQRQWEIKNEFKEKLELQAREEAYERRMTNAYKDEAKDKDWMQSFNKANRNKWDKKLDDNDKDTIEWAKSKNRIASRNSQRKHNNKSPHSSRHKHILNTSGTLIDSKNIPGTLIDSKNIPGTLIDSKNISSNDISLLNKQLQCRMGLCG